MKIFLPTDAFGGYIKEIFKQDTIVIGNGNNSEIKECDFLVLMGGEDVSPIFYGQDELFPELCYYNRNRDEIEFSALESARRRLIPTLGICRGMQVIGASYGGRLYQDIRTQTGRPHKFFHPIEIMENSLVDVFSNGGVNSLHHQGVEKPPREFSTIAYHGGVLEAMQNLSQGVFAVQFHPEFLWADGDKRAVAFFEHLREWVISFNRRKEESPKPSKYTALNSSTFTINVPGRAVMGGIFPEPNPDFIPMERDFGDDEEEEEDDDYDPEEEEDDEGTW